VLQNSYDAEQRAAAAWIIGYAPDKQLVIDDLLYATRDPDDGVRNNAMRALGAITVLARRRPELGIRVSPAPFIEFLNSISLSDRNKALAILVSLRQIGRLTFSARFGEAPCRRWLRWPAGKSMTVSRTRCWHEWPA
jgi:hypothetical protein